MAGGADALASSAPVTLAEKASWMGSINPLARKTDQPIRHQPDSQLHNPSPQAIQSLVSSGG